MITERTVPKLQQRLSCRGQAVLEYVLLLGLFVVVVFVFMKMSAVLVSGFKIVVASVAGMAP